MQHKYEKHCSFSGAAKAALLTDEVENFLKTWLAVHNIMAVFMWIKMYQKEELIQVLQNLSDPAAEVSALLSTHTCLCACVCVSVWVRGAAVVWAHHSQLILDSSGVRAAWYCTCALTRRLLLRRLRGHAWELIKIRTVFVVGEFTVVYV